MSLVREPAAAPAVVTSSDVAARSRRVRALAVGAWWRNAAGPHADEAMRLRLASNASLGPVHRDDT